MTQREKKESAKYPGQKVEATKNSHNKRNKTGKDSGSNNNNNNKTRENTLKKQK